MSSEAVKQPGGCLIVPAVCFGWQRRSFGFWERARRGVGAPWSSANRDLSSCWPGRAVNFTCSWRVRSPAELGAAVTRLRFFPFCGFQIQEETEMWKIREWEKQTEETYWRRRSRMLSDTSRWAPLVWRT